MAAWRGEIGGSNSFSARHLVTYVMTERVLAGIQNRVPVRLQIDELNSVELKALPPWFIY
jgi:hypothetical protein